MKKKVLIILFLFASVLCFCQNNEWSLDRQFPELTEDEEFDWVYDDEIDALYIVKKRGAIKTLYTYIYFMDWGNWQFSGDRREILFYRNEGYNYSDHTYYILDGNTGKTRKIDLPELGTTNNDFGYLLKWDYSEKTTTKLRLWNMDTNILEKEFIWNLSIDDYLPYEEHSIYILRSIKPGYDFHVYLSLGIYVYGECYIDVKNKEILTIIDGKRTGRVEEIQIPEKELTW